MSENKYPSLFSTSLTRLFMGVAVLAAALKPQDAAAQAPKKAATNPQATTTAVQTKKTPLAATKSVTAPSMAEESVARKPAVVMHVEIGTANNMPSLVMAEGGMAFNAERIRDMATYLVETRHNAGKLEYGEAYSENIERYRLTPRIMLRQMNKQQQINAVYDYIVGNLISKPMPGVFADVQDTPVGNKLLQSLVENVFVEFKAVRLEVEKQRAATAAAARQPSQTATAPAADSQAQAAKSKAKKPPAASNNAP